MQYVAMSCRRPGRLLSLTIVFAAALLAATVSAQSASAGVFKCRASVAYIDAPGLGRVEPVVANGAEKGPCRPDSTGIGDLTAGGEPGTAGRITIEGPTAETTRTATAGTRNASADTGAARVTIEDSAGHVLLGAGVLRSRAFADCSSGRLVLTGSSDVADVELLGRRVTPNGLLRLIGNGTNGLPIGEVLRVRFDDVTHQGNATTDTEVVSRSAVHLVLKSPTGTKLLEAALGESRIGRHFDACTPPPLTPAWQCRSSLARLTVGRAELEPVVSNGGGGRCSNDRSGFDDISVGNPLIGGLTIQAPDSQTLRFPGSAPAAAQTAVSKANAAQVRITSAGGGLVLAADVVTSRGTGRCVNGEPRIVGETHVADVTINGRTIPPDGTYQLIGDDSNGLPLGQILAVTFNEQVSTGDSGSVRQTSTWSAVHARLLSNSEGTLLDAVVGETQIGRLLIDCSS